MKQIQTKTKANPRFAKNRDSKFQTKAEMREARVILLHPALFTNETKVAA